jgi:hypothetical protein
MNFDFNPEEHIDTKFYRKFLDSSKHPNLTTQLKEDLHKSRRSSSYSNIISLYSNINLNEIQVNQESVLSSFDKILQSIKYTRVNKYFKLRRMTKSAA